MDRILILGGGVGGTLTANLLVRKLRHEIDHGQVELTVVDETGSHVYQPGFMYIAMGGERAANLQRPERSLLDKRVQLVVGQVASVDAAHRIVTLVDGLELLYDQLVLATGSRIVPEAIEHFDEEAHHFYTAAAAAAPAVRPRRVPRRADRDRDRRHAVQVPAGPARGRLPHRVRAP